MCRYNIIVKSENLVQRPHRILMNGSSDVGETKAV